MRLGLHLPNSGPLAGRRNLVDLARDAEALGVDSLWVADHLFNPVALGPRSKFPGGQYYNQATMPYFNALTTLFVVAGATDTIKLGTSVLIVAYRQPVELAKQLGTLSALVGDRFILGVGAGWLHEEFEAVGIESRERFGRLDEALELMRNAWSQQITSFDGRFYQHAEAGFRPVPGTLPVFVGGRSDGAIRRVARSADGWSVAFPDPGDGARAEALLRLDRLHAICEAEGRDPATVILMTTAKVDAPPSHFELIAELGFEICDVVLTDESDLDLGRYGSLHEFVAGL